MLASIPLGTFHRSLSSSPAIHPLTVCENPDEVPDEGPIDELTMGFWPALRSPPISGSLRFAAMGLHCWGRFALDCMGPYLKSLGTDRLGALGPELSLKSFEVW